MPIPDAQAGPPEPTPDPLNDLARKVTEICNRRLRGEIDEMTWEKLIEEVTRK